MSSYKTEQKKELISFLTKNSHRSFTIEELCREMAQDQSCISPPGKSTVYRLIPRLLEDNIIKQFNRKNSSKTVYQIVGGQACNSHIHLKCTGCGKLLHAGEEVTATLCSNIALYEDFQISTRETVIFGLCKNCI